jgi:RNA-binding protein YlmH
MLNRQGILNKYNEKNDKIFASNILDKIAKFEKTNVTVTTNFLNINEFRILVEILNKLKIKYKVFSLNDSLEKKCIALISEYDEDYDFSCVSCIKVLTNSNLKLLHKDYMGSIYNIGITEDMIGDIIVFENYAYIFLMTKVLDFILLNYTKVGISKISTEVMDINNLEDIAHGFEDINIIVPSSRIDTVLAHVYKLSRSEVENKISRNELYINSKCITSKTYILKENDIVAFRKCGKFKFKEIVKKTGADNLVIKITVYK